MTAFSSLFLSHLPCRCRRRCGVESTQATTFTAMLPLTLLTILSSLLSATLVSAGSNSEGQSCSQGNNHLQVGTYQFDSDCDSQTYCAANGTCVARKCRNDVFPLGYAQGDDKLPPLCPQGQFCPDEMDACQPLLAVGSQCQLNRDDECEPPPNFKDLADKTNFGLNNNGSVCLNFQCMWANVTVGLTCVVENTPYIVYGSGNQELNMIVSRCVTYSSSSTNYSQYLSTTVTIVPLTSTVMELNSSACRRKPLMNLVGRIKSTRIICFLFVYCTHSTLRCSSMNCLASQKCGAPTNQAQHLGVWVYVVVGVCIFGGMFGTLIGLFFLHSKQREKEREKRNQYWREQVNFHFL